MITATSSVVVFVALLATSVWVGGFVAIVVVVRVARHELGRSAQVAFFRTLGRAYLWVSAPALAVMLAAGVALLAQRPWDGTALAAVLVGGGLLLVSGAAVAQARGMTRLRSRALREPNDRALVERVRRGGVRAGILRSAIGLLSLGLLALAAVLAT